MKPRTPSRQTVDGGKLGRELLGLFSIFCGLLFALSLATFDSRDPWLNHVVSGVTRIHNKAGLFGAYVSGLLYDILGSASWIVPALLCLAGARLILGARDWPWWRWTGFCLLAFCICLAGAAGDLGDVEIFARGVLAQDAGNVSTHGGGIIGHMLYVSMVGWLSATGTFLIWLFGFMLAVQMLTGISWLTVMAAGSLALRQALVTWLAALKEDRLVKKRGKLALAQAGPAGREQSPLDVTAYPVVSQREPDPTDATSAVSPPPVDATFAPVWRGASEDRPVEPHSASPIRADREAERTNIQDSPELYLHPVLARQQNPGENPLDLPSLLADSGQPFAKAPPSTVENETLEEEEELPPWVRDFEQDRHGVQPPAGDNGAESGEDPALAPALFQDAAFPSSPVTPDMAWPPSPGAPSGDVQDASGVEDGSITSTDDSWRAAVSPQTAAAVDALRSAAASETMFPPRELVPERRESWPEPLLRPEADTIVPTAASSENGTESPASPQQPAVIAHQPEEDIAAMWREEFDAEHDQAEESDPLNLDGERQEPEAPDAPPPPTLPPGRNEPRHAYTGPVHVAERPTVEAAPTPSAATQLMQRIVKPAMTPLPPLDLLQAAVSSGGGPRREVLEAKGRSLMTCLNDFGIQGELVGITPGPVVTMFELRPAPGVRVSRIANLSDDLALALKAVAVRIQAPVPGTDTVGIEIPNEVRETVCLKELLGSQAFQQSKSLLTLALGKDIAGVPAVADLATMPHLLVAGATGAGKSVGINSIILSLIYKARPEQVKLLLVDPKRVEMAIYADLPHLVHPVVTEMQLAKNALEWAVAEMERRYTAIAKAGVRNIGDYNVKLASWEGNPPAGMEDLEPIPYLVLVIDELADLMLVAAKEVETSIVRLAQLARAAGIHLILATQRPSVDVVTGLIKANFPCRISFQVTSKHDSRTILDAVGAEHLLGRGDMLFKPGGGKFRRMHGAFVSDQNVNAVVDYWKHHQRPDYQIDFAEWAPESGGGVLSGGSGNGGADIVNDPLYNEAVEFVRQQGKASISLIQRKFRIGFNKAARFVEQMEVDGIIGPADGSKPRMVIR